MTGLSEAGVECSAAFDDLDYLGTTNKQHKKLQQCLVDLSEGPRATSSRRRRSAAQLWSGQGCWWRRRLASWSLFPHHEGWGRVLRHGALQPLPQAPGRLGQAVRAPLARARSPFFSGVGGGERKLSDWVSGYSVELALLLAVRAPPPPRLPPPLMLLLCSRRCRSGSLFFLSALALVNSLGMASPYRVFPTVLVLVPRFVGKRYCVPYA
jgi:hypothetical protein